MRRITIWVSVACLFTVFLAGLIYALQETGKVLGTVKVDTTGAIIALVVCGIILVVNFVSRAGAKYSFPVERYIITHGLAPEGVTRLSPGSRETGDFLMVMAAKSEARMCGRELGGDVEITIATEPNIDIEAQFSLEYLRRNSGKHGIEVK